jgi:hypothetical protein
MSKVKTVTNDPDNYAKMSIPFESTEAANEALSNFHKELGELRKKYKIPDLLIVTKGSVKHDGETGDWMQHSSYGSSLNQLTMAAYAYGQLQAEHKELISKLIAGKTE